MYKRSPLVPVAFLSLLCFATVLALGCSFSAGFGAGGGSIGIGSAPAPATPPATPATTPASAPASATTRAKIAQLTPEKEPKPEFPGEAAAHWAGLHETPPGETAARLNLQAVREITARERGGAATVPNLAFEEWGPGNYGGRLRGLVVKNNDADTLLVGSVSGGVWKTTDGGATWTPQDDFLPSLAVGSMLTDPDDDDRVWMGTGEGFFNVDAAQGAGIFQSDDFGATWTQLASTDNSDFNYVNRLARIPSTDILLAATRAGLFRSTDLGANWNEVSGITISGRGFSDLQVDPSDTTRLYAYHYGGSDATQRLYRSTDSGASWTELGAGEGLPTTDINRMEIGIGSDGVIYVAVGNNANQTRGLYRSPAGGAAFAKTASNTAFIERQGWYDLAVGVDPSDSDRVYMAAVDLYRTTDAGTVITKRSFWNPGAGQVPVFVHADHHVITFHPSDAMTFWVGTDGGIYKTTDGGDTFVELNNDLRVAQYYGMAVSPDGSGVIGGTQDNGTHLYFGDRKVWLRWAAGDGSFAAWDQQQPLFIYGGFPGAAVYGSNDGGLSTTSLPLPDTGGALFIAPFTLDPNDGDRMLVGTDNVFYSGNVRQLGASSWTDVSGILGSVNATTISPLDGSDAYAGTTAGGVFGTTGLGTGGAWSAIDSNLPNGSDITWIEVDENDPSGDTLYVTLADYGTDRVWKTTDRGGSWSSIHGDLPDIPMFVVRVDPTDPNRLWLGSELGLWTTDDNGGGPYAWERYGYGAAWTRVMQMKWSDDDTLYLTTHGRSFYRAERDPVAVEIVGLADDLSCDVDGYLDSGETGTIEVEVTNRGGLDLTGVTVSLASDHPGLTVLTGPQAIGTIGDGGTAGVFFTLELTYIDSCLQATDLTVTVDHDDGDSVQQLPLTLAANPTIMTGSLFDGAEGATLFTHLALVGTDDWTQTNSQANTGTQSWFAADVPSFADKELRSPWMEAQPGGNVLTFALYYDLEGDGTQLWDGALLELRTEGGDWVDIGTLSTVAYDGQLFTNNTAPARLAWSGTQTTWRAATVDLGATYSGQRIQFRYRVVCDTSAANPGGGFWVDDIQITNVEWLASLDCDSAQCGLLGIFSDGFESGNTSAWDVTVP